MSKHHRPNEEQTAVCPECTEEISFPRPLRLGQIIKCPECYAELQVVSSIPLELMSTVDDEEEVWEYQYEEEDDDDDRW